MVFSRCVVWFLALFLVLPWTSPSLAAETWPGELVYKESSPHSEHLKQYDLAQGAGGVVFTLREQDIIQEITSLPGGLTSRETYRNVKTGDFVEIVREPGHLAYSGTIKGRAQQKIEKVDDSPWYGSVLLLRNFVLSGQDKQIFHLTRAEETSLVTLEATRQGRETILVAGHPVEAVKIKMTLPGMKAWMWKSLYWFRASDGILVRSEGTRGPASPVYTVELMREAPAGDPALSQSVLPETRTP